MSKLEEAKAILDSIGMPKAQQSDLCAYTLLALSEIVENKKWSSATNNYIRIHDIMEFIKDNYDIAYAENSRETFRKQAMHHFRIAALIEENGMATNSPNYKYRITAEALNLFQKYNTPSWNKALNIYLKNHEKLVSIYENKRNMVLYYM